MITVFVWPFENLDTWGHASLSINLSLHGGDHYISWWPTDHHSPKKGDDDGKKAVLYSAPPIHNRSFLDDCEGEALDYPADDASISRDSGGVRRKSPKYVFNFFHGLKADAIVHWWRRYRHNPHAHWQTLGHNCSETVVKALKKGGADEYIPWWVNEPHIWTPNSVVDWVRVLRSHMHTQRSQHR